MAVVDIYNTDRKYEIIYADPPWSYRVWAKETGGRTARSHYQVMSVEEICKLPVNNIADNNSILFLWATYPNLPEAFKVIDAWGFEYKTVAFTWVKIYKDGKPFVGLGHWTRANAEICLLATKGSIKRANKNVSQIIISVPEEHSKKPDEARDRIVMLMGDLSRIELFARQQPDGWDVWGNEVSKLNFKKEE
jgi:N6-adenosine-specific RNA methylase IME4